MTERFLDGIQACVFDAYGTLFDVSSAVSRHARRLGDAASGVSGAWRDRQLQYTWLRSLMGRHADFGQVTGDALDFALASHGIDDPGLRADLLAAYRTLDCYPEVPDTLKALGRRGLKCAILSNGSPAMLADAVASGGLGGDLATSLSAEEAGIFKPHPRVYALAADYFGVPNHRIAFFSSNAWDVAGAAAFGFRVAWINRFAQVPERLPGEPAIVIHCLSEVLGAQHQRSGTDQE